MASKTIDHTKFHDASVIPGKEGDDLTKERWWTQEDPDKAAACVAANFNVLFEAQASRRDQLISNARLYGNLPTHGMMGLAPTRMNSAGPSSGGERVSYNVVKATSDTARSRIGKNKPEPFFVTSGGNANQRRRAQKLTKFCRGLFDNEHVYELGLEALLDGIVWGDGATHVYMNEQGDVKFERVLINELFIDEIESFSSAPRQLIWVRQVDRGVAMERWPEAAPKLKDAFDASVLSPSWKPNIADLVTVYEAWHLPSGPDAKDGKHIVCIDGHAIVDPEPWEYEFFPFGFFQWSPRLFGWWGVGLPEEIQSIQQELNRVMRLKQRSFHMMGSFKVLVEAGSRIVSEHLDREVGTIIRYQGTAPTYVTPPAINEGLFQYEAELKASAYQQPGISQTMAQGQKPSGVTSGKAIREVDDLQTDRLNTPGQSYERYYLQLARVALALVRAKKSYTSKFKHRTWLEVIDWKDIDLKEDEYVMSCFPISSLPNTPAGRLQTVTELSQAGMYSLREAKRLLNFPDLEQVDTLQSAQEEWLLRCLDNILDEGEVLAKLDDYDDANMALELGLEYLSLGKLHNLEDDKLELLRQWVEQSKILIAKHQSEAAASQAQSMQGGMGPPQANPAPAPVSPLLPNAPQ